MLSWSINLFRIRGIRLAVHYSFFLLLAYFAWEGWLAAGGAGVFWSVLTLVAFFTCVVMHELGHSFTAMHFGVGVRRILLMPIGGMAEFDSLPRQPSRELLITLAGPAVNFALAGALWLVLDFPEDWSPADFPLTVADLARQVLVANLVMGIFNLIPVFPMDGGRIFRALLATRLPYVRATRWAANLGKLLSVAGALLMIFAADNFFGALLFGFILIAGETEYRAVLRREQEDAHWREVLARLYPPPPNEPPLQYRESR